MMEGLRWCHVALLGNEFAELEGDAAVVHGLGNQSWWLLAGGLVFGCFFPCSCLGVGRRRGTAQHTPRRLHRAPQPRH